MFDLWALQELIHDCFPRTLKVCGLCTKRVCVCVFAGDPSALLSEACGDHGPVRGLDL